MPHRPLFVALVLSAGCAKDGGSSTSAGSTSGGPALTTGGDVAPTTSGSSGSLTTTTTSDGTTGTNGGETSDATTGAAVDLECEVSPCFNVINGCNVPLWIHAANNANVVLAPDGVMLAPGATQQYVVPEEWSAGRVNAYWQDPRSSPEAHDKVEVTRTGGVMNYNITYVDYVGLPAEVVAVGPDCVTTPEFDPKVGCYVARDELLAGCPDDLRSGDRCLSAGLYCSVPANQEEGYCHLLDGRIAECAAQAPETCGLAGQLGDSTRHVYACAGYFDGQPPDHTDGNKWCAALNRGMLAAPDSTDTAAYYKEAPYNSYAKWVHAVCPGIYAFPYDDYPSNAGESGFRACAADRLDITFCPRG